MSCAKISASSFLAVRRWLADMQNNYYFLGTLLPDLRIGDPPEIALREYETLLEENLTAQDLAKTHVIRNYYDILNLRLYWKGDPLSPLGNFDSSALEEAFATRSMLPRYVFDFIDKYASEEERLRHFPALLSAYFKAEIKSATGLFKRYLILERELSLVTTAYRAKKLGRDILTELQYEDPDEEFIAQMLAQKDASAYTPPEKYEDLKAIFEHEGDSPLKLHQALIDYRFRKIDEWLDIELFSIDRIIGYMLQLIMVTLWQEMDRQKGIEIVDTMLKESHEPK